jgi:hypothetical protein
MEDGERSIQEVRKGTLPPLCRITTHSSCLIVAENWPSWLTACHRYSFHKITIVAGELSPSVKNYLSTLQPSCQWAPAIPVSLTAPVSVLLQGSTRFLRKCLQSIDLSAASILVCCDESPSPVVPPPTWHWRRFNLAHYGGVVDGPWQLQSPDPIPSTLPLPHAPLFSARLKHFLDDTVRGVATSPSPRGRRFCPPSPRGRRFCRIRMFYLVVNPIRSYAAPQSLVLLGQFSGL